MYVETSSLKENPVKKTNIFLRLTYGWVIKLFILRLKRQLTTQDLYKARDKDESARLGNQLEIYWENELLRAKTKNVKPNLLRPLFKLFKYQAISSGLLLLIFLLMSVVQPLLLAELLKSITNSKKATKEERNLKFIYGGAIALMTLVRSFVFNHGMANNYFLGMRIRIACSSLLFRKIMRLSNSSVSKVTAGQLVNLLGNDALRFDLGLPFIHYLWTVPIQIALGLYMIWYQVGVSSLSGVMTMFLISIPIQGLLGKLATRFRLKVANRTDTRVKHMTELVNGIQVIKMYAWEKPFEKIIAELRKREISIIRHSSTLKGVFLSLIIFTDRLSLFVTITCFVLLGNDISSDKVFSLAQFFNALQMGMVVGFPLAVNLGAEILVSVRRFEEYLTLHEKPESNFINDSKNTETCVSLNKINAAWVPDEWSLRDINIKIPFGSLCILIGSVGCGKSSILHLILGELTPSSGTLNKCGDVSYASQEPWLFVGSVRDNILFGQPYIRERYKEVVKVCALEKDFQQLPHGDKTLVGEQGVSLSGGQRARINLARAVYREADIYLLDDPLSAVDTHVSKHLFQECITSYLKNKTRILVTHQLQFLKRADIIIVIDEGKVIAQGTFQELLQTDLDIKNLLHIEKDNPEPESKQLKKHDRTLSIVSTASTVYDVEEIRMQEEEMGASKSIYWPYFRASGGIFKLILLVIFLLSAQALLNGSDIWLTYWIDEQEDKHNNYNKTEISFSSLNNNKTVNVTDNNLLTNSSSYFYNTDNNSSTDNFIRKYALQIYAGFILLTVVLTFTRSMWFMMTCMRSSINLHNKMFHCLIKTVMRFFDTNPSGRILNRFAKDMGTMDEVIPRTMLEAMQIMLVMIGILVVIVVTNYYMIIAIAVLGLIGYKYASMYTETAKDVKRLEGITKSPMFSHVKASYDGLTTIRSSNAEIHYINEFDALQDRHTSTWYLTVASRAAFSIIFDLFTIAFVTVVIFSFILLNEVSDKFSDSTAGLAISQSLILTGMVQIGSQQITEVINQMTSVERILEYTKLEKEKTDGDTDVGKRWPSNGTIRFKNLYLQYDVSESPVLKNLSFSILPGQKVGIVGRTGAGKSSIIAALFLLSPIEGHIFIDDVDTKKVQLHLLRSKISIIPQKPVLFSTSVRDNLDPFGEYTDEDIWNALNEVEMKTYVPSLEYFVHESGVNFSVGQRQLLCLARAILRNNKILILDEATANVDQQTDALIQSTIRRKFGNCTVLTIAHRLNTIMDSDVIFVMHAGELVESGHPHFLLQNFNGYFFKLVAENEDSEARRLHNIANQNYLDTLIEGEQTTQL